MDEQLRSPLGGSAGRGHVDDGPMCFAPAQPGNQQAAPLDFSGMGFQGFQGFQDPNLVLEVYPGHDLGGSNTAAGDLPALENPPFNHPQAILDPERAWEEIQRNLLVACRDTSPWNPVFGNGTHLAPPPPGYANTSFGSDSATTSSQADAPYYLSPRPSLAPSTWDGGSTLSGYTDNSNRSNYNPCRCCGTHVSPKLMQRHHQEVHRQVDAPQYLCKCQHTATRKSNYTRHLRSCKVKDDPQLFFTCICNTSSGDLQTHLDHVMVCGRKRPGRRPNSARPV